MRRAPVEQAAEHVAGETIVAPRPPISIYCEHYQAVIELIGRRWMGAILRVLMSDGPRRFNELLAAIPGLSDRLLTERLRELTEQEIVERVPAPDISPIAIQYRLTESRARPRSCRARDIGVGSTMAGRTMRLWRDNLGSNARARYYGANSRAWALV